eukprot:g2115.t1
MPSPSQLLTRLAAVPAFVFLLRRLLDGDMSVAVRVLAGLGLTGSSITAVLNVFGGPGHLGSSPWRRLLGLGPRTSAVRGFALTGWEPVARAFVANFDLGLERGAQLCVYHRGVKVVELTGTGQYDVEEDAEGWKGYDRSSLQVVYSCTKVLTSLAVAAAVQCGILDYDERVSHYWPEFSEDEPSKADITVGDPPRLVKITKEHFLSTVAGGVPGSGRQGRVDSAIARLIEASAADFPRTPPSSYSPSPSSTSSSSSSSSRSPPGGRAYHGITRGLVVNELLVRADPERRTVGQWVRQMITNRLGPEAADNVFLGDLPASARRRLSPMTECPKLPTMYAQIGAAALLKPVGLLEGDRSAGRSGSDSSGGGTSSSSSSGGPSSTVEDSSLPSLGPVQRRRVVAEMQQGGLGGRREVRRMSSQVKFMKSADALSARWDLQPWFWGVESPSTNGLANARGLAAVMAACAGGGELGGRKTVFTPEGLARALGNPETKYDDAMCHETCLTNAGLTLFTNGGGGGSGGSSNQRPSDHAWPEAARGYYGWGGIGGSAIGFNPATETAVAYTMNGMGNIIWATLGWDADSVRFPRILEAIAECVHRTGSGTGEGGVEAAAAAAGGGEGSRRGGHKINEARSTARL